MINIQNKSNFQVRTDYSDVYSRYYYQLHNYKVKSTAIFRKLYKHLTRETIMENYHKLHRCSLTINQTIKRENMLQQFFGWFLTPVDG